MTHPERLLRRASRLGSGAARVLTLATALAVASDGWSQVTASWSALGPAGGTVSALLVSPTSSQLVFAGTPQNGIFVSADGGTTWNAANGGLTTSSTNGRRTLLTIRSLASDGRYVFAATDAGLFYAPAAAAPTWTALVATTSATPITRLAFEPMTSRLFASSDQADASTPAGVYIASVPQTIPPAPVWSFAPLPGGAGVAVGAMAIAPSPALLAPATLMASVDGALFIASILPAIDTLSWVSGDSTGALAAGTIDALAFSAEFGQAFACSGSSLLRSGNPFDAVSIWLPASVASTQAFACKAFATVPIASGGAPQALLGTDRGAFVSLDGVSFLATGSLGPAGSANAFAIGTTPGSPASNLLVGGGSGVAAAPVATLAGGAVWSQSNGPASTAAGGSNLRLNTADVTDTAVIGSALYAAVLSEDSSEVWTSVDRGANWTATRIGGVLGDGEQVTGLLADPGNATLFAATTQGLLALGVDSGWVSVGATTIPGRASALAFGSSALFVGTDNGVFAVPRGIAPGATTPIAAGLAGQSVRSLLVAGTTIYAGTIDAADENFVLSTSETAAATGTAIWNAFGLGSAGTDRISSLLLVGDKLLAATQGNLVLYASSTSGWAPANTSTDPTQQISDVFGIVNHVYSDGISVYASTGSNGVFVSAAGVTFSWSGLNGAGATALPSTEVHTLRADNGTLYAATRAGVASMAVSAGGEMPPASGPLESTPDAGGGAFGAFFAMLLLGAVLTLRRYRV